MADEIVTTQQGETLDGMLWRRRGIAAPAVATVLAANPGLADLGAVLPIGTAVRVPAAPAAAPVRAIVQLWD